MSVAVTLVGAMGVCVCKRSQQSYFHTLLEWQFDNDDTTAINPVLFLFKHQPAPTVLTVETHNSLAELHNLSPALQNEVQEVQSKSQGLRINRITKLVLP